MGTMAPYTGSMIRMDVVRQSMVRGMALLTNHTSARKGFLPPKGMPYNRRSSGRFSVLRTCLPGPNLPMICPLEKNTASCDSLTRSCVLVLRFWWGNFHA